MSPDKPRIAGELRLRVASSDDPASFESGSDLLRTNGQVWSRPLFTLLDYYPRLYEKLREERLVPDDLDKALSTLLFRKFSYSRTQFVYTLNDAFIVNFTSENMWFAVITEQGVEGLPFHFLFSDRRGMCMITPYTGAYTSHQLSIYSYIDYSHEF